MFSLPFAAAEPGAPDFNAPIDVGFVQLDYWCFKVASWLFEVDISNSVTGPLAFSGICAWNYNNERFTNPSTFGSPASELFLGMGWQIRQDFFDGAGAQIGSVSLFNSFFHLALPAGYGYWNDGGILKPYLTIGAGGASSYRLGTSLVVCTIDGITVPMQDDPFAPGFNTGTITLSPFTYWP